MEIRFIAFVGRKKETAKISFNSGFNLVYGPSNTGKSSVLDALDFMLGRERPLKEIPQHEGYEQILLGVKFSNSDEFTFIRNINGGDFECFEGLHKERPLDQKSEILRPKLGTKKIQTISDFILGKLGLKEKRLRKNAKNKTIRLTLRNILPVAMITETNIQKEKSPYISEQYLEQTVNIARLKFVLTGVDDSFLLPTEVEKKRVSRSARIDMLDELIIEQKEYLSSNLAEDETLETLLAQEGKISETISSEEALLETSEEKYNSFLGERAYYRHKLEQDNERLAEISEMLSRFDLLRTQYKTDILRLDNISEAGSLIVALPSRKCPLCGSDASEINTHSECDGNIDGVVSAAGSEKQKIQVLYADLLDTMTQLNSETKKIEEWTPETVRNLRSANETISELNPELTSQRKHYSELVSLKTRVEKSIEMFTFISVLQKKKEEFEEDAPEKVKSIRDESTLPTQALSKLSQSVNDFLRDWNFSNTRHVHFDKETGDFFIDGKHRISNGKGHRAITHAAATLALMKYTERNALPHLGFAVLDSPLLAYEEPEDESDDLNGTDVNVRFLDSLAAWGTRQTIIFENKKSIPEKYISGANIVSFTGGDTGRFGFFPFRD
jgi:AAA15 family ATPase/GTPase